MGTGDVYSYFSWTTSGTTAYYMPFGYDFGHFPQKKTAEEIAEAKQLAEDKKRFPLLFWKENCR